MSVSAYQSRQNAADTPLDLELRVFGFVTQALSSAGNAVQRVRALQRNHDMWLTLITDLAHEENPLPDTLRARLISIGLWQMKTSLAAMEEPSMSVQAMIDINREIAAGLADQARARVAQLGNADARGTPAVTAV